MCGCNKTIEILNPKSDKYRGGCLAAKKMLETILIREEGYFIKKKEYTKNLSLLHIGKMPEDFTFSIEQAGNYFVKVIATSNEGDLIIIGYRYKKKSGRFVTTNNLIFLGTSNINLILKDDYQSKTLNKPNNYSTAC